MNHIVNPWIFYFVFLADSLRVAAFITMVLLAIFFIYVCDKLYDKDIAKLAKKGIIVFIICVVTTIVTPNKDTCYKMIIASYVTTENINCAKETVRDIANYIVDTVRDIKSDDDD